MLKSRYLGRTIAMAFGILVLGAFGVAAQAARVSIASSTCPLTPGKVYRTPAVTTVYFITAECQKRPIFNPAVYFSYYADWNPVNIVTQSKINAIPDHPLHFMPWGPRRVFQNGSLIKTTDIPYVYLIEDGKAYPFGSEEAFKLYGYTFDQVEDVSLDSLSKFQKQSQPLTDLETVPVSVVFKYSDSPTVYVVVSEAGTLKKKKIASMDALKQINRADRIAVFPRTKAFSDSDATVTATPAPIGSVDVTVTIDPTKTKPISPYIYGINFNKDVKDAPEGTTFDRFGGNRWTAYNWENNASNAGSDWQYSSDNYLGGGDTPAEAVRSAIADDESRNQASLITLQLQGYVSADEKGSVDANGGDLSTRFKKVVDKKGSAFTADPSTTDANVYMDEFAWALDQKLPGIFSAQATHPTFVSLDNEPELWNSTHSEIQTKTAVTSDDYVAKTISLTKALKDQFPDMTIFGPVHYGFLGMYNWQGETAFTGSNWFVDKYLKAMKAASESYGKRLLDVYDFHWYSEAQSSDGSRVTGLNGSDLTADQVQAIVQSPRSLWDPTFTEKSWISQWMTNGPIAILKTLQSKIDADWPGTKIAITEYENGGDNHIAGTIAEADDLGIFGSQGVYAASWWPPGGTYPYTVGAFRAYRGFDGANANFGDTSVQAVSSDVADVSAYASTDSKQAGRSVFVAINRSTSAKTVALNGLPLSGTAAIYRITAGSAKTQIGEKKPVAPALVGQMAVSGSSMTISLPALSVTTIEVK